MKPVDTVGRHLAMALCEKSSATEIAGYEYGLSDDLNIIARHEGAAAGHAFRAVELAYDLGQAHARGGTS